MAEAISTPPAAESLAADPELAAVALPEETAAETQPPSPSAGASERLDEVAAIGSAFGSKLALEAIVEDFGFATAQQRHTALLEHRVAELAPIWPHSQTQSN